MKAKRKTKQSCLNSNYFSCFVGFFFFKISLVLQSLSQTVKNQERRGETKIEGALLFSSHVMEFSCHE